MRQLSFRARPNRKPAIRGERAFLATSLALLFAVAACSGDSNDVTGRGGAGGGGGRAGDANSSGGAAAGSGGASGSGASLGTGGAGGAMSTSDATAVDATGTDAIAAESGMGGRRDAAAGDAAGSTETGSPVSDGAIADRTIADAAPEVGRDGAIAYNPCPTTAGTACAVLPLGDSITEGFASSGAGYRVELFRQTVLNGKNLTFVGSLMNGPDTVQARTFPKRHEGHDGFTIDTGTNHSGISGMITDQAMSTFRPAIVLLMIGTNDLNGNFDIANAPARLGALIDEITADNGSTLVVVASIIPIATDATNQRVIAYNAAIPGLVSSRAMSGKHVVFVDNYAVFASNPNYRTALMADNLHPNDAGYALLGQSFYGAISALLPAGP